MFCPRSIFICVNATHGWRSASNSEGKSGVAEGLRHVLCTISTKKISFYNQRLLQSEGETK